MSDPAQWPNPSEAAEAYLRGIPEPEPEPDLISGTLAAAERLAQRALKETNCGVVSVPVQMEGVTFKLVWHRPKKWWQP